MKISKKEFESLLPVERLNGDAIVTFHIGRGGRYWNQGHKSFAGHHDFSEVLNRASNNLFVRFENESEIMSNLSTLQERNKSDIQDAFTEAYNGDFDELNKWGITEAMCGELSYADCNGNILCSYEHDGTGILNIDGEYDTTYSQRVIDCNEQELKMIVEHGWEHTDAYQYALSSLVESGDVDIEDEEEGEDE